MSADTVEGMSCPYLRRLADINPRATEFMDDPFEFYRLMRAGAPVYREACSGIYYVASYELVARLLRDQKSLSSAIDRQAMRVGGLPARVSEIRAKSWPRTLTMTRNDDVDSHKAYRDLVSDYFLPRNLVSLEPFVKARIEALLEPIRQAGTCDFVSAFAVPLPIAVITRYLGFDCGEAKVKQWSDAIVDQIGLLTSEERAVEVAELEYECHSYIVDLCARRRVTPGEGLASVLANAKLPGGRPLSDPELISMISQMMVAGNETTTNSLSAGTRRLASHPELVQRLRAEPKLIAQFVEETLRLEAPVQGQFRRALVDIEIGGMTVPAGSLLHLRFASANRDELIFGSNAEQMHLGGRPARPHLAFGAGMHFCLGAMLSRLELRMAFGAIVSTLQGIELAVPDSEVHHLTNFHLRGLKALPLQIA